jgi:hypothetical protein
MFRSRERRIEPFVDMAYLVTDNVAVVGPCRAAELAITVLRCSKNGDKRVTGSGISSFQARQRRATRVRRGVVRDRRKINLIDTGACDN